MGQLVLQRTRGGLTRVAPGTEETQRIRRLAMMAGLSGRTAEGQLVTRGLSLGGVLRGGIKIGVGVLTGGIGGGISAGLGLAGKGGGTSTSACPAGFKMKNGKCVKEGFEGGLERALPGGETGVLEPQNAVVGAFGLPAITPAQVGSLTRNDGVVVPLLRCGRGFVLGKDNLCYPRVILGRRGKFRKHPASARPPITAGDARAIRMAASARKRVKKLAGNVGFTCSVGRTSRKK